MHSPKNLRVIRVRETIFPTHISHAYSTVQVTTSMDSKQELVTTCFHDTTTFAETIAWHTVIGGLYPVDAV
jgi:hypothetical protein